MALELLSEEEPILAPEASSELPQASQRQNQGHIMRNGYKLENKIKAIGTLWGMSSLVMLAGTFLLHPGWSLWFPGFLGCFGAAMFLRKQSYLAENQLQGLLLASVVNAAIDGIFIAIHLVFMVMLGIEHWMDYWPWLVRVVVLVVQLLATAAAAHTVHGLTYGPGRTTGEQPLIEGGVDSF